MKEILITQDEIVNIIRKTFEVNLSVLIKGYTENMFYIDEMTEYQQSICILFDRQNYLVRELNNFKETK